MNCPEYTAKQSAEVLAGETNQDVPHACTGLARGPGRTGRVGRLSQPRLRAAERRGMPPAPRSCGPPPRLGGSKPLAGAVCGGDAWRRGIPKTLWERCHDVRNTLAHDWEHRCTYRDRERGRFGGLGDERKRQSPHREATGRDASRVAITELRRAGNRARRRGMHLSVCCRRRAGQRR